MEFKDNGEPIRNIPVSSRPFDMAIIDTELIAVSYGRGKSVEIMKLKNYVFTRKMKFSDSCYGISYKDGKLYTVVYNEGIVMKDLTGKTLNTIKCDVRYVDYVITTKDRIYYTNYNRNTVYCCKMTGDIIWVFTDASVHGPSGLSVDNNLNVFIVGLRSNNLTVIQHDGTKSKQLLNESNGLNRPRVVYFEKNNKVLFVGNIENGYACLYQVI